MTEDRAAESPTRSRARETMGGLAKGLAIIEAFAEQRAPLTVAGAAQAAGVSRASARRCLLTMVEAGYLRRIGSQFVPTPRMLRLGSAYFQTSSLPELAQSHLDAARDALSESVSLAVLEGDVSVFVARSEAPRLVSTMVRLGAQLPAYCSATGRVLLSALDDADLEAYLARIEPKALSEHTVTDRAAIRDRVLAARRDGLAITLEELEIGMISLAVPVKDANGRVLAAMSLSASSARVGLEKMRDEMAPILTRYADALSRSI